MLALVVDGAADDETKSKAEGAGVTGFSGALGVGAEAAIVGGVLNKDGAAVGVGVGAGAGRDNALPALVARMPCCLSLIFDIAAASRSCFSHFEYDFAF